MRLEFFYVSFGPLTTLAVLLCYFSSLQLQLPMYEGALVITILIAVKLQEQELTNDRLNDPSGMGKRYPALRSDSARPYAQKIAEAGLSEDEKEALSVAGGFSVRSCGCRSDRRDGR
jgi:hypothetical protein